MSCWYTTPPTSVTWLAISHRCRTGTGAWSFQEKGSPIAQVCDIEIPNLLVHGWDNENIYVMDWRTQMDAPSQLPNILQERGYGDKRIGVEARLAGCRSSVVLELQAQLPNAKIQDASHVVLNFRGVKSPAEMECVRQAASLTDIGMLAGLAEVAPGKTDNDMLAAACDAMARAGSEYLSIQPLTYTGAMASLSHVTAKRRAMKAGETVTIELTGVYQRYAAPLFRSAVLGEPSDLIKRLAEYSITCLGLLFENARPGPHHSRCGPRRHPWSSGPLPSRDSSSLPATVLRLLGGDRLPSGLDRALHFHG